MPVDVPMRPPVGASPPGASRAFPRFSIFLRRTHMYLALFLTPWMTMYALSTIVFNHWGWVSKLSGGEIGAFGKGQERPYKRVFSPGMSPSAIASGILEDLHLRGSVKLESSDSDRLVITRLDPFRPRRITWIRSEQKLIVEKQGYQTASFLTALHSRVG